MTHPATLPEDTEERIAAWRDALLARRGVRPDDVHELEDHLRGHMGALEAAGLTGDEALLVAIQRVGAQHEIAADLARENTGRLWKQHVGVPDESGHRRSWLPMLGFAVLAGLATRATLGPAFDGGAIDSGKAILITLVSLAVVVAAYLAWVRRAAPLSVVLGFGAVVAVVTGTQLAYPYAEPQHTQVLALLHAAIVLALAAGAVHLGRRWRDLDRWMDYLRFLGEWFIYYVLLGLGGGVLLGLAMAMFAMVGLDSSRILGEWVYPMGIGGAIIVSAWLVEAKQGVVENMAPVLAKVFTPLFVLLLVVFLVALLATGNAATADRDVLIVTDLVLVVVLGLHLYTVSARPVGPPNWGDRLQLVLVVVALLVDVVVLAAMAARISEFGASPNKVAALGENLVLAGNLAGAAWLSFGFLRGRRPFIDLERWQCRYLPVIGAWALAVVVILPPVFGFR